MDDFYQQNWTTDWEADDYLTTTSTTTTTTTTTQTQHPLITQAEIFIGELGSDQFTVQLEFKISAFFTDNSIFHQNFNCSKILAKFKSLLKIQNLGQNFEQTFSFCQNF